MKGLAERAPSEGEDHDQSEYQVRPPEAILDQAEPTLDGESPHCRGGRDEQHHHPDCLQHDPRREHLGTGQGGDDPEQGPSRDVVDHPGCQDGLPELTAHQVQVHQDLGQDRDGRDGEGGGNEQCEDGPIRSVTDQPLRDGEPEE